MYPKLRTESLGYPTVIFPCSIRSKGLTPELLLVYGYLIFLAFVNPVALDNIGWHYYIFFCCFDVFVLVVSYFMFPETKGYSLEELAEVFDGPGAVRQVSMSSGLKGEC
jgi:hypothetical protein